VTLGDVAEVCAGGGAPQGRDDFGEDGTPFVRAGSIAPLLAGAPEESLEKLTPETASKHGLRLFPAGTVLFAKSGMSATKGSVYRLKAPAYVVNHLAALVCGERLDSGYLMHYLRAHSPSALIKDEAYPSIRLGDIAAMLLPLPSLSHQRRIVSALDMAHSVRANRGASITTLDELASSVFIEAFGDPASNPKKWPLLTLGQVGKVITGNTPSRAHPEYFGSDTEWVKSDNLNTPRYFVTRAAEGLSLAGRAVARVAPPGAILVTCIAGTPGCIGNCGLLDREVAFNQQINALVPTAGDSHFFYALLRAGKRLIQAASTEGMKGMVNKSRFESIEVPVPPLALQKEFGKRALAILSLKEKHEAALIQAEELYSAVQHRAFSGAI
jgi:type I restriction enzyme S subunit